MANARGRFIVIDGMDGSGKGTQIKLLQEKLVGKTVLFTREPGGTPKAEEIREMLLDKDGPLSNALCDFFLFWAARASHVEDSIAPAIERGEHVLCDRYDSSTYAFQLFGEQQGSVLLKLFEHVRETLPAQYHPHTYIILDLPAEVAYKRRLKDSEQEKSRFDMKPVEYHQRVRDGFKGFPNYTRSMCHFVDANRSPEEVFIDVWKIVSETCMINL